MQRNTLKLLILSIGGNRYGIDIDQIAYLAKLEANTSTVSFENLMAIELYATDMYTKMIVVKGGTGPPILINEPEEVTEILIGDIRSVPDILRVSADKLGVWGFLWQEGSSIILVDFYKNQRFTCFMSRID